MLGLPPNTVQDQVAPLDLHGFRGNDFTIQLNIVGDAPMPAVVECIAYHEGSKKPWPTTQQPTSFIDGQSAFIRFVHTDELPEKAIHTIRFNSRTVLSGKLIFDRQTIAVNSSQEVNLTLIDGNVVNVTVLIGASEGGIPEDIIDAPDFLTLYQLFKQA